MADIKEISIKIEQLQKKKKRLIQLEKNQKRKQDTRVKIIYGGAFLALMKKGGSQSREIKTALMSVMSARDSKLIETWEQPVSEE